MFASKFRWEKKIILEEDLGDEEIQLTDVEKEEQEIQEASSRSIYDHNTNTVDMGRKKATEMKGNRTVKLPDALRVREECKLSLRLEAFRECYHSYRRAECSQKGDQRINLSKQQFFGLQSL